MENSEVTVNTPNEPDSGLQAESVPLRLSHVWKRFPGVDALKDVSFSVLGGEVHALLGENGAGKSTLMAVASGEISPEAGTVEIAGRKVARLTFGHAQRLGLSIVHQHPAVMPDLTVAENMLLAVPRSLRESVGANSDWVTDQLERVSCDVNINTRMEDLSVAQRQLVELGKALAINPAILVLDEPTAPLSADMVGLLFEQIRLAAARGAAVVYISHRLPEVREIADRVTVMRDGEVKGCSPVNEMSDEEMLQLIVGRTMSAAFPPKHGERGSEEDSPYLVVESMSGAAFHDVNFSASRGEVVGLAGISGNGQSEFLRALAGLESASGSAQLLSKSLKLGRPVAAREAGIAFLSSDRHNEGLFMTMSVRENVALSALPLFSRLGVLRRRAESARVEEERVALEIRTPSLETSVSSLSGGNQQKVALARALLSKAKLVLADEPTQGVDVGARAEIYRILRELADAGVPIVVVSSDGLELEGLCDRVIIFSRGEVVGELSGDEVTEEKIARCVVTATTHRRVEVTTKSKTDSGWSAKLRHFAAGDYAPSVVLALIIVALGAYVSSQSSRFLSGFNISTMLTLITALAFIGFGQMCVILTGGIDLSVGPLAGLLVVIASFFIVDGKSDIVMIVGLLLMLGTCIAAGLLNGMMVRFGRFTPIAATLTTYIAFQGISLLLRPFQGGYINSGVMSAMQTSVHDIPLAFIAAVGVALGLEFCLRYTRWGLALRAAGSDEKAALRVGVRTNRTIVGAYVACSVLTFFGGLMLMVQIGIGDPNQGVSYTLSSVAAVVVAGTSLFGGRGAFVGVLLGAALIQEINTSTTFLNLSQAWQYWFLGILTLGSVAIYSQARRKRRRRGTRRGGGALRAYARHSTPEASEHEGAM
jgi:ribose transport system ATP-binding protein